MLDATDLKAHPTVSSLNKGARLIGGTKGDNQQAPWGLLHTE